MKHLFLCIMVAATCFSVAFPNEYGVKEVIVCGYWPDYQERDSLKAGGNPPSIAVYEKHLMPDFANHHIRYGVQIERDSFYMTIPLTKDHQYIQFLYFGWDGKISNEDYHTIGELFYLVQPGDSIHISRPKEGPAVIASDNELINYQYALLSSIRRGGPNIPIAALQQTLDNELRQMEANLLRGDSVDHVYRNSLSPYLFSLARQNFRSYLHTSFCQRIYISTIQSEQDSLNIDILHKFEAKFAPYEHVGDRHFISESSQYLASLLFFNSTKGVFKARLDGIALDNHKQLATFICQTILENKDTYTRDQLLAMYFKWSSNVRLLGKSAAPLIQEALTTIRDTEVQHELVQQLNGLTGGEQVEDYEFFDVDSNVVSLRDFKGKVVMAHFWYLGCGGCIDLTNRLGPLLEKYSGHPDVIFLNISVDKTKERWMAGLQSGQYHHPKYEQTLYVGPIAMGHPLLQYYGYNSMPSMLLVGRDGRLISSRPPRPSAVTPGGYEALDRLIADNLAD